MTPEGWEEKFLGEIVDLKMGGTPARNEPRYWDSEESTKNRWVAISDIKHRFLVDTSERISNAGVEKSPVKLIEPGTPLMSFKLSIGKATIPLVPVYTNEAIVALDPIGPADKTFLYYAVPPAAMRATASVAVKGKTLNKEKLREIPILLPPLSEQRKIAAVLSSVDEVIEKTEAVIEQLRVVKKAMMQDLLTRGIPGRHARFKQTKIGEIPEEWEVLTLGAVSDRVTSGSRGWAQYYAAEGPLFIRITNLTRGSIDLDLGDLKHVSIPNGESEGTRTRLEAGDLLISITADLGLVALVRDGLGESYVNQHLALVRIGRVDVNPEFVAHFLTSESAQERFWKVNDSGAKAGLNLPSIRGTLIALPSQREQEEISGVLNSCDRRVSFERETARKMRQLKAALTTVLLTGEVRVTPDEVAA